MAVKNVAPWNIELGPEPTRPADREHIERLKQTLLAITGKPKPTPSELRKAWPFPAIRITPTGTGNETDAEVFRLVYGQHRLRVALELGLETIPADVRKYHDEGQLAVDALAENLRHGLPLDIDRRDELIKQAVKTHKVKVRTLAKELGLSPASISRIANSRQRKTERPEAKGSQTYTARLDKQHRAFDALVADIDVAAQAKKPTKAMTEARAIAAEIADHLAKARQLALKLDQLVHGREAND